MFLIYCEHWEYNDSILNKFGVCLSDYKMQDKGNNYVNRIRQQISVGRITQRS